MKMSKSLGLESSARPGKICCRRASFWSKTSQERLQLDAGLDIRDIPSWHNMTKQAPSLNLFSKEQMGCASANDLCAANWFSRHSWAFQYVCHQLFDSGMSSKDVKHNPGQPYQRLKNYKLFSQKRKRDSQKKNSLLQSRFTSPCLVMIAHFSWPRTWHDAKTFRNDSLSKLCLLSLTSRKLFKTFLEKKKTSKIWPGLLVF